MPRKPIELPPGVARLIIWRFNRSGAINSGETVPCTLLEAACRNQCSAGSVWAGAIWAAQRTAITFDYTQGQTPLETLKKASKARVLGPFAYCPAANRLVCRDNLGGTYGHRKIGRGTIVDTVMNTMGEAVKSAVMPTRDTEAEAEHQKADDAAEPAPPPVVRKKRAAPQRANKRAAKKKQQRKLRKRRRKKPPRIRRLP